MVSTKDFESFSLGSNPSTSATNNLNIIGEWWNCVDTTAFEAVTVMVLQVRVLPP